MGKLYETAKEFSHYADLNINDLSNGIYFLDIKDNINGNIFTVKMIKQ